MITLGLMSGTSLDGLDGVLIRWHGAHRGFDLLARGHRAFDPALRAEFLALNTSGDDELHRGALAANRLSVLAADLTGELLSAAGLAAADVGAIGLHGQTVRHRPGAFDGVGYTLQLHNASLLAELSGIDVVCDFRSRDVAAGGQGAPLVPAFHAGLWAQPQVDVAVLNLGGIANLTLLHSNGEVAGFDCGPANVLMDLWCQTHLQQPYDADGAWAAQGRVDEQLLQHWQQEPFFALAAPKSTGRDLFHLAWLKASPLGKVQAQDVQATLCELTAWAVDEHLRQLMPHGRQLLVCGGGALNGHLMRRLKARLCSRLGQGAVVEPTSAHGLDAMDVEASAFAWLAWRFICREPGNLVQVTGARGPRILGALYPAGPGGYSA